MFDFVYGRALIIRFFMLISMFLLVYIGISTIYATDHPLYDSSSANTAMQTTYVHTHSWQPLEFEKWEEWQKQLVFALTGFCALIAVNTFNYRKLGHLSYWIYAISLLFLAFVLFGKYFPNRFVPYRNGAYAWIKIPGLPQIQPSEFARLTFILAMAWYLRYRQNCTSLLSLLFPFGITAIMLILILKEPDLGTVLLMIPVLFAMLFVAGAKAKHLIFIILTVIVISPFIWNSLETYQKKRIAIVILQSEWIRQKAQEHPALAQYLLNRPTLGNIDREEGFQLLQSKLAIASGGAHGNGYRRGPYLQYNILPERHNDFIFSVYAHQFGFVGCLELLLLYVVLIACGLEIAWLNTDPFGRLVSVGIVALFSIQVIVNISMTVGLMPVTGLTLPFVSYGGSSLFVSMTAIGLLNNIGRCRPFSVAGKGLE